MEKILLPVDFSDCTEAAVQMGIKLALKHNAHIELFHAVESSFYPVGHEEDLDFSTSIANLRVRAEEKIEDLSEILKAAKVEHSINITSKSPFRQPHKYIVERSKEGLFSAIVLGTAGEVSDIEQVFIGSNAQKVVRNSKIPVTTVKPNYKVSEIDHVVYVSDFNEDDLNLNIEKLFDFVAPLATRMTFLFINTPMKFESSQTTYSKFQKLRERFDDKSFETVIYNEYSPEAGIYEFVKANEVDLVSISTHGYKGISHFLNNNITENIVNNLSIPVLSFNAP
jgi:nucleotide-binding universal stress UspA family protein